MITCYSGDVEERFANGMIKILPIAADNHCLYRAMAIFTELGIDHASTDLAMDKEADTAVRNMRDDIATEIERSYLRLQTQQQKANQRARMYQHGTPTDQKAYVKQIRQTEKWGGELEIAAFSRLNPDRCIIVIDVREMLTHFYTYGDPTRPAWLLVRKDDAHYDIGLCPPRWKTMKQQQVRQRYGTSIQDLDRFAKTCTSLLDIDDNISVERMLELYRQPRAPQQRDRIGWTAVLAGVKTFGGEADEAEEHYIMHHWDPGYTYAGASAIMTEFWRALALPDKPEGVDRFCVDNIDPLTPEQASMIRALPAEPKNLVLKGLLLFLGCYINDQEAEFSARALEEAIILDHARRLMPPGKLIRDMLAVLVFLFRDTTFWDPVIFPSRVEFMTRSLGYFYYNITHNLPEKRGTYCDDLRKRCLRSTSNLSDTSSTLERLMAYRLLLRIERLPLEPKYRHRNPVPTGLY